MANLQFVSCDEGEGLFMDSYVTSGFAVAPLRRTFTAPWIALNCEGAMISDHLTKNGGEPIDVYAARATSNLAQATA